MNERPIIMSAPMVRATIREIEMPGTGKTQTRRIIKAKSYNKDGDKVNISIAKSASYVQGADGRFYYAFEHPLGGPLTAYVAYFHIGDCLWVRETWQAGMSDGGPCVAYRADNDRWYPKFTGENHGAGPSFDYDAHPGPKWCHWIADVEACGPWASPLHMPRWAARLFLTVVEVRVQRLQAITEGDARAEGIIQMGAPTRDGRRHFGFEGDDGIHPPTATRAYTRLWDSIHGEGAWLTNPWVAVIRFRPERTAP